MSTFQEFFHKPLWVTKIFSSPPVIPVILTLKCILALRSRPLRLAGPNYDDEDDDGVGDNDDLKCPSW